MSLCLYSLLMTEHDFRYLVPYIGQILKKKGLVYCGHWKSLTRVRLVKGIKSLLNRKQHLGTESQEGLSDLAISLSDIVRKPGNKCLDQKAPQNIELCVFGTSLISFFFCIWNNKSLVQKTSARVSRIKSITGLLGLCKDAVAYNLLMTLELSKPWTWTCSKQWRSGL